MVWAFETSKPALSDTPPSTRPHLPILPKQFYHVEPTEKKNEKISHNDENNHYGGLNENDLPETNFE